MRPIPDDVQPVPKTAREASKMDAGASVVSEGGAHAAETAHNDPQGCQDSRHHPLHVRQSAPDRWTVARAVMDVVRTDKARVSPQLDASGHIVGLLVDEIVEGSCLGALGFQTGDLIRTVNGQELGDWSNYSLIYRSIMKDGSAVVRFDRRGHPQTVLYEINN